MKLTALIGLAAVTFSTAAFAQEEACTTEALQAKATEAATAMQAIGEKNPERMQEIALEMQTKQTEAETAEDLTEFCAFYDGIIAEAAE